MKKLYSTKKEQTKKNTIVIKTDVSKLPNKMHLEAQLKFPSLVQEDKRRKKPKHKGKIFDND